VSQAFRVGFHGILMKEVGNENKLVVEYVYDTFPRVTINLIIVLYNIYI
jgi:hypothetical protein